MRTCAAKSLVCQLVCVMASMASSHAFFSEYHVGETFAGKTSPKEETKVFDKLDMLSGGKTLDLKWMTMERLLDSASKSFADLSVIVAENENCPDWAIQWLPTFGDELQTWMKAYWNVAPEQRWAYESAHLRKAFGDTMSGLFKALDNTGGIASGLLDVVNSGILFETDNADASTFLSLGFDMAELSPVHAKIVGVVFDAYNVLQDISKIRTFPSLGTIQIAA